MEVQFFQIKIQIKELSNDVHEYGLHLQTWLNQKGGRRNREEKAQRRKNKRWKMEKDRRKREFDFSFSFFRSFFSALFVLVLSFAWFLYFLKDRRGKKIIHQIFYSVKRWRERNSKKFISCVSRFSFLKCNTKKKSKNRNFFVFLQFLALLFSRLFVSFSFGNWTCFSFLLHFPFLLFNQNLYDFGFMNLKTILSRRKTIQI